VRASRLSGFGHWLHWLGLWTAVCVVVPFARGAEAHVRVDARTRLEVNGVSRITGALFGVTAFEGFPRATADADYCARLYVLKPGCVRFPGNVAWNLPEEPVSTDWFDTPHAMRMFTQALLFGARYPIGRFLPVARNLGAEPMCSLGSPPKWLTEPGIRNPSDFQRWADICAAYVGLWRKIDPEFRLVQIWNEPNAAWFRDPRVKDGKTTATKLHIDMALKVAGALKKRFPDILVGGPVLCWPPAWPPSQKGHSPWYTWDMWTIPWLKETAGAVDFFDFHAYDVSPEDFAVQVEMAANAAERLQGRRIPIWITESNYRINKDEIGKPDAEWTKRVLPYERFLFHGVLTEFDKIAGNLYHDLHARRFALLPNGADSPAPIWRLFWILRDLRGVRVIADSSVETVAVLASVEDDRTTGVLFNDAGEPRTVHVDIEMPCTYWTGPMVRGIRPIPGSGCGPFTPVTRVQRQGGKARCTVETPAHATVAADFFMNRFGPPPGTRRIREFFGDANLIFLQPRAGVRISIPVPDAALRTATKIRLRLGLLGPVPDDRIAARLNGRPVPIVPASLQDAPVDKSMLNERNVLEVVNQSGKSNPRLALGFAALVFESSPSPPQGR